jgi:hypothetical protein
MFLQKYSLCEWEKLYCHSHLIGSDLKFKVTLELLCLTVSRHLHQSFNLKVKLTLALGGEVWTLSSKLQPWLWYLRLGMNEQLMWKYIIHLWKVACLFCLSCWDPSNHNGPHYALDNVEKSSMNRVAPICFWNV